MKTQQRWGGGDVATLEECRQALTRIASRLARDPAAAARVTLDRSFGCHIRDLDAHFHGRLQGGEIVGLTDGEDPRAQLKIALTSDDLLALVAGQLNVAAAFAGGRLSIRANPLDLLRLRKMM